MPVQHPHWETFTPVKTACHKHLSVASPPQVPLTDRMEPASGRQTAIRFPLGSILGEVEKRKILPVVKSDLKTLIIHKCPHTVDKREW